jgi:hypothetical protein
MGCCYGPILWNFAVLGVVSGQGSFVGVRRALKCSRSPWWLTCSIVALKRAQVRGLIPSLGSCSPCWRAEGREGRMPPRAPLMRPVQSGPQAV